MITKELRRAWRFFHEHSGWSVPPGKAQCALNMARAERDARDAGLTFEWYQDDDAAYMDHLDDLKFETCEYCLCRDESGTVLASLGGVLDADNNNYRRVVEAELAQEALAQLDYAI